MEGLIILLLLGVVVCVFILPVIALIRAGQAARKAEELEQQLANLQSQLARMQQTSMSTREPPTPAIKPSREAVEALLRKQEPELKAEQPVGLATPLAQPSSKIAPALPPIIQPAPTSATSATPEPAPIQPKPPAPPLETPLKPSINWEQFMGVKLFAWVGGLALFLAVVFFVKYSFEHNLIPPEVRVALGFVAGIGLLSGGVVMRRKDYAVTSQTLISTGVLVLYASAYAAHAFYHFAFFGVIPTFLVMTLITATAFALAVRLDAMVVAVLGMLGGFLTPILLSTGVDNPLGLFGYIALLDAGLLAVALNRRWFFLAALAAVSTVFMQIAWTAEFFRSGLYYEGNKVLITMAVLLGFALLYLTATGLARRRGQSNWWFCGSTLALSAVALGFTVYFLGFETLGVRPWLVFGCVFLVDLVVLALVWMEERLWPAQPVAGLAVFLLLAGWTTTFLNNALLPAALVLYLLFAVLHTVVPVALSRLRAQTAPSWCGQAFPPFALLIVLIPIFKLSELSFLIWPFLLLVDVLAVVVALISVSLLPVIAVLLLTLLAAGAALFQIPTTLDGFPLWLIMLGCFSAAFVTLGERLAKTFSAEHPNAEASDTGSEALGIPSSRAQIAAQVSNLAAILPFLLLIVAVGRLPLTNPSPVFGLAAVLVVMQLGMTRVFKLEWMPVIGLACVGVLEAAWHVTHFDPARAVTPLQWYVGFYAVFAAFPFVFRRLFADKLGPWIAAAASGPLHFLLTYRVVKLAHPNAVMGLVPAAFAVPALVSLAFVIKQLPAANPKRLPVLAWFGGVALLFITLIFPIQFERQWITIGWAIEGAALLWLLHRVPHEGLKLTGTALLIAAFVRLALNPTVLEYHARTGMPILNWYLYAYGVVTVCLFAGARLLASPRNRLWGVRVPPILYTLATVLAFLLVNIEIADFFTEPGAQSLTFKFSGDFGSDMTYSIVWAVFAFVLLVGGIARRLASVRYAALGLLTVTVLKLFLHDLARLEALYRIGAFMGVAIIAIGASFIYQRFLAMPQKADGEPRADLPVE